MLDGQTAFELYDTYGFPLDLTQDEARRRGFSVNIDSFQHAMAEQRARSREHWKGSGQKASQGEWLKIRDRLGPTVFTGYDAVDGSGEVLAMIKDGQPVDRVSEGETAEVVFDQTPFYGEGGGQAGDQGEISWPGGTARVIDVQKPAGDLYAHAIEVTSGTLEIGTRAAAVGRSVRAADDPGQPFGHPPAACGPEECAGRSRRPEGPDGRPRAHPLRLQPQCPRHRRRNRGHGGRGQRRHPPEPAGDDRADGPGQGHRGRGRGPVRREIRRRGPRPDARPVDLADADTAYSVELCGGTHVARTGDIALFKIVSESGIAAGVRRIEALTGEAARQYLEGQARVARGLARDFKIQPVDVPGRVEGLTTSVKALEKQVADLKKQLALGGGSAPTPRPKTWAASS
jgi:alanyl-tRNA synthetase